MSQQNECSKLLPSDEFYKELNKEIYIKQVYEPFCYDVTSLKSDSRYEDLCHKVARYLTVNESNNKKKISCNHCNLLIYWIFDQINNISAGDTDKIHVAYPYIGNVMSNIMNKYYDVNKSHCVFDFEVPYDNYWKAKKEFYEYCLDYNEINAKKSLKYPECDKYRNYLTKKTDLLAHFKQILSGNKFKKCPHSDGENLKCNPNDILDELSQLKDFPETRNHLADESSNLFLGLSKKNTATAASVAGVSLLGLTLFKVKRIFIYQFEYLIVLLILSYH
ncbi:hypothetical protein PVNG_06227 [Plasmodium vivax North Korean]|uniref:Uncharacterized protein n=1 Tax=Plasmodium vivax North Korean TaxID=1035514 RepID=A0A0J9TMP5_PLAVI|nr:hypothetical protein PVNG_06227 [Plasmodium vivax North Korean]